MKAEITIEQFNNGYTLKWRDPESGKPVDIVSLDRDKTKDLGDMIWGDIKTAMDAEGCNTIKMEIEYEPIALSKSDQVLRLIENVISHPQNFVSGDQSVAEGMIERITKIIETKITQ